jgi:hypothetical protein
MLARSSSFLLRIAIPLLAAVPIAIACGEDIEPIPNTTEGTDSGPPPGSDGGDDGGELGDGNNATDAPDVICPTVAPDESAGVFVATSGATGATCGTKTEPCRTIAGGIARASALARTRIYVARGVYVEKVLPKAGMRIEGGWDVLADQSWNRACSDVSNAVVIRAPAGETTTVFAKDLGGKSELAFLRVESKTQNQVKEGESLFGVLATGATTTVALEEVAIEVANAGNGKDGPVGAVGADPAAAGTCNAGTGANGTRGAAGAGASAGTFDPSGYSATDGTLGAASTPGANGTAGPDGTCVQCGTCSDFPACNFVPTPPKSCGTPGKNGCGGGNGAAGVPGDGGGSSVGLFAWDATVTVTGGRIRAGDAGNGGIGGNGGTGKTGSAGAVGTPTANCIVACAIGAGACTVTMGRGEGGQPGGAGGTGAQGALSGGGSGGSSFAIFQGGAGLVTAPASIPLQFGKAGKGGGPDAGVGANGLAAARYP